ncbi:unnamed protein product [Didymodactylos carnosus]|uniref:CABIT domain-containing protein n=1 Tax=Didymodactylos carnosus TaxID=1234261 RepID=A0A814T142_9BILA|nr:unnamed protein product [Didymodactylos carnosus]CAF1154960.1 unnamed protein product [Didymodactylos carnosus]CAF3739006.1 unnamed protein product [Didymodactylos carnosus]CAF3918347.1 unnamed protein product [Didymodactylos carnosus]
MLKWAVVRSDTNSDVQLDVELHTLDAICNQYTFPCLVRLYSKNATFDNDNYYLLLTETCDPYLVVSNETERFAVPTSNDGLFAQVERGVTRYSIFQSIRTIQTILTSTHSTTATALISSPSSSQTSYSSSSSFNYSDSSSSSHSSSTNITHFTTLQPCIAYNFNLIDVDVNTNYSNSKHLRPGTILEQCRPRLISNNQNNSNHSSPRSHLIKSPSPIHHLTTATIRTLFSNIPQSINKHLTHRKIHYNYLEVKCQHSGELFLIKMDQIGAFVPVITHIHQPPPVTPRRSSAANIFLSLNKSSSSNITHSLFTAEVLSKCSNQYPFITELITSRLLEGNDTNNNICYPFRRSTVHRCEATHARIIAFDMKHYTFIELDKHSDLDLYIIEQQDTLERYQAQLRWCNDNIQMFRSSIKSIIYRQNGSSSLFVQTLPLSPDDISRRNSVMSSVITPPLLTQKMWNSRPTTKSILKRTAPTISLASTPIKVSLSTSEQNNNSKKPTLIKYRNGLSSAQTSRESTYNRVDVRTYFNDPNIQERLNTKKMIDDDVNSQILPQYKRASFYNDKYFLRSNSTDGDSEEEDDFEQTNSYECTPL